MVDTCLNVAMTFCYWCGKENGIAIGSRFVSCKDKWKTKYVFTGYEPCDECKSNMDKGFTIMEVEEKPLFKNQPEIQKGIYPTGFFVVITNEAKDKLFKNIDTNKCFMDEETFISIGLKDEPIM